MRTRLTDLGEHKIKRLLIENVLKKQLGSYEYCDATYVKLDDKLLVTSCDGYVGSSWILPFMSWRDVGWKVCSTTVSDLLVKFARPIQILASINIEGHRLYSELEEIILGMCEFCKQYNISLGKLDLNEATEFSISACAIGIGTHVVGNVIQDRGVLYTVPEFGYTGIVFKLLELRKLQEYEREPVVTRGIHILRRPNPPFYMLDIPRDVKRYILATTDSSDGLGAALWNFAELSKCRIDVFQLPVSDDVLEVCQDLGLDIEEVTFNGAEEYLPVLVLKENIGEIRIGNVKLVPFAHAEPCEEPSVVYKKHVVRYRGWEYFRRASS